MHEATQRLVTDVKTVAADARELIAATADQTAEHISVARDKASARLADVSMKAQMALDQARTRVRAADDYVHDSPWAFIGAAALLGALVGFIVSRR
jgi:ElaB/YqjD/DUF883 family membrane-anchored ribosome-binding protein